MELIERELAPGSASCGGGKGARPSNASPMPLLYPRFDDFLEIRR
jgi:hypothetical protein